jgi:hypothetical protein
MAVPAHPIKIIRGITLYSRFTAGLLMKASLFLGPKIEPEIIPVIWLFLHTQTATWGQGYENTPDFQCCELIDRLQ